jgi:hypothetical protein
MAQIIVVLTLYVAVVGIVALANRLTIPFPLLLLCYRGVDAGTPVPGMLVRVLAQA